MGADEIPSPRELFIRNWLLLYAKDRRVMSDEQRKEARRRMVEFLAKMEASERRLEEMAATPAPIRPSPP